MGLNDMTSKCNCNHNPGYLQQEIAAGRPVQKFVERGGHEYPVTINDGGKVEYGTGEYVLICLICGKLWNHETTDWLIETIMAGDEAPPAPREFTRKRTTLTDVLKAPPAAVTSEDEAPHYLVDQTAYRARKKLPRRPFTREMYHALQELRPQSRADARDRLKKNLAYFDKVTAELENPSPREKRTFVGEGPFTNRARTKHLEKEYGGKCRLPNLQKFVAGHGGDCSRISLKAWDQFNQEIENWKACIHCDDHWSDSNWRQWFARKTLEIWEGIEK